MSKQDTGRDTLTPTRTSRRLAGKRKHYGKPGCPCCTRDHEENDRPKRQKGVNDGGPINTSTATETSKVGVKGVQRTRNDVTKGKKQSKSNIKTSEMSGSYGAGDQHEDGDNDTEKTPPDTSSDGQRKLFMSVVVELEPEMLRDLTSLGCDWRHEIATRPGLELVTKDGKTLVTSDNVATIMGLQSHLQKVLAEKTSTKDTRDKKCDAPPQDDPQSVACDDASTSVNSYLAVEMDSQTLQLESDANKPQSEVSQSESNSELPGAERKGDNIAKDDTKKIGSGSQQPQVISCKSTDSEELHNNSKTVFLSSPLPKQDIQSAATENEPAVDVSNKTTESKKFIITESRPVSETNFGGQGVANRSDIEYVSIANTSLSVTVDDELPMSERTELHKNPSRLDSTSQKGAEVVINPLEIAEIDDAAGETKSEARDILESLIKPPLGGDMDEQFPAELSNISTLESSPQEDEKGVVASVKLEPMVFSKKNDIDEYQALVSAIIKEVKLESNDNETTRRMRSKGSAGTDKNGEEYTCTICNDYTGTKSGLQAHKNRHHPNTIYRCDVCRRPFGYKRECIRHKISHYRGDEKRKLFKLMKDQPRVKDEEGEDPVQHLNMDKLSENLVKSGRSTLMSDPSNATHSCKYCQYMGTKSGLRTHLQRYHPKKLVICDICGANFGTQQQLNIHMAKHIKEERQEIEDLELDTIEADGDATGESKTTFQIPEDFKSIHKCDLCEYKSTKSGVRQHKERHHREKNLECDICKKRFGRKCDLNTHRTRHFDSEGNLRPLRLPPEAQEVEASVAEGTTSKYSTRHTCDICGFRSTFFGLKSHRRREHTEKRYECDVCLKKFIDRYTMMKHRASHFTKSGELKPWMQAASQSETGWSCFRCPECPSEFPTKRACDVHAAKAHPALKNYMCDHCLFTARTKDEVEKHVARKHEEHTFKCDLCDKTYAFQHDLQFHVNTVHEKIEQCSCDICGKEFSALKYLKMHIQRHEKKYRCYCPVCNKGFMAKARMNEHIETHKPEEERTMNYCCEICGKKFIRKSTMLQHMDGHLGNRPHECNICHKAFTLPQTLSRHKKIHDTQKPYTCQYGRCGKTFLDKTSYQYHLVTHTGHSKHKCETCGKHFTQAATLRRHKCKKVEIQQVVEMITGQETADKEQTAAAMQIDPNLSRQESQELISILDPALLNAHQNIIIKGESGGDLGFQTSNQEVLVVLNETSQVEITQDQQLEPVDQDINSYMCSVCEQLFASWDDIQAHMQLHIDSEVTGAEEVSVDGPELGIAESVILEVEPSVVSGETPDVSESLLVSAAGGESDPGQLSVDESTSQMVVIQGTQGESTADALYSTVQI